MQRARIALISSSFAPAIGGVEEAVRHLALGLHANGHVVEVWTVDRDGASHTRSIDGITVRYLPAPLPAQAPGALARFARAAPRAWREWRRAFTVFRPDRLHVHCFGPNGLYALGLHHRFAAPLYLTSHGETFMDDGGVYRKSALLRVGLRHAIKRAEAVTAPSDMVLADLRADYGLEAGVVIANGVDLAVRGSVAREAAPCVFAVGRLVRVKGFDLLLEAFRAADLDPSIRLVVGGDGPERRALEQLAVSLGLVSRVEFPGWLPPQAVADAMAGALAVVVPSRVEAFGIVALEAWRSAAPLIMTEFGGARDFVRDGVDGILVDPEDTDGLAQILRRVVQDAALRAGLAQAGSARVAAFSWSHVVERYERVYEGASSVL